jgi:hypothetical protein
MQHIDYKRIRRLESVPEDTSVNLVCLFIMISVGMYLFKRFQDRRKRVRQQSYISDTLWM